MSKRISTFCRICETQCGLVAEVEGNEVISIRADADHPVTQGYACQKGLALKDINSDPDRLNYPLHRGASGSLHERSWEEAISKVGAELSALIERYGPNSIATYHGNPSAFNTHGIASVSALARGIGTQRCFSSSTQDCANKFVVSEALYGGNDIHPIPDLENTELCLVIGSNPRVSQGSFFTVPNVMRKMKEVRERGARFVFVNPRRIESADRGMGDTIQIKPDTDVYLLAALLTEIDKLGGFNEEVIAQQGKNVAGLRDFIAQYDAENTAAVTGVAAVVTQNLALQWVQAKAACVTASTGINMGRHGAVAYWLVQMLVFLTGNLDRPGGNLRHETLYNKRPGIDPQSMYEQSKWGKLRKDTKPGNLLADFIEDENDPIRALVVIAGNPLLSVGGGERLRHAFEKLELLVVVDIYQNATAEFANWILPVGDPLERDDINVIGFGIAQRPYVQYTPAVVEPAAERRSEWWICHRLLQEIGAPSALDDPAADRWSFIRNVLAKNAGIDFEELKQAPNIKMLPDLQADTFFTTQIRTEDQRVDCCPEIFAEAIGQANKTFDDVQNEPEGLKLISRREPTMMNSWMQNVEKMHRGCKTTNPLHMNPDDAASRGLQAGTKIRIWNEHGSIEAVVALDPELLAGVVAMAHGWGNERTKGMRVAQKFPGANCNALLPTGPGSYDALSGQAHMVGVRVEVEATAS